MPYSSNEISKSLYIREDLRDVDFSQTNLSGYTFVECDMRGVKLPGDLKRLIDVSFVNCMFSLGESKHGWTVIAPFYNAELRLKRSTRGYLPSLGMVCPDDAIVLSLADKDLTAPIKDKTDKFHFGYKAVQLYRDRHFTPSEVIGVGMCKLAIPESARSVLYYDDVCRAEKAVVVDIYDFYGNKYDCAQSFFYSIKPLLYYVGDEVYADSWDDDPVETMAHGIHFFYSEREAWEYAIN